MIETAIDMSKESQGLFDISIGAVSNLWKIGDEDARKPSDEEIKAALPFINYKDITLDKEKKTVFIKEGMTLELGAISKGYIADKVRELFASKGITTAIINLGGNVVVMGIRQRHKMVGMWEFKTQTKCVDQRSVLCQGHMIRLLPQVFMSAT